MKFYPLKNWRKGQETVIIAGERYYTLDAATKTKKGNEWQPWLPTEGSNTLKIAGRHGTEKEIGEGEGEGKTLGKHQEQEGEITSERPNPTTRARKRPRETPSTPTERSPSQDCCTQRNPLNVPFRPSAGYTPPPLPQAGHAETTLPQANRSDEIAFLKLVLAKTDHATHGTAARRIVTGIYDFLARHNSQGSARAADTIL